MTTYLSGLLTSTTSKYNNLRKTLLSDETDGESENDSHISRVLRAYYTEKGRQFPEWLPPDSSRPQAVSTPSSSSSSQHNYGQPLRPQPQQQQSQTFTRRGGALSDLWADTPKQQAQPQQPASLRTGRPSAAASARQESYASNTPQRPSLSGPSGARPPPSQREGSYQTAPAARHEVRPGPSPTPSGSSGGSTQDKLKARLWGAGRP